MAHEYANENASRLLENHGYDYGGNHRASEYDYGSIFHAHEYEYDLLL